MELPIKDKLFVTIPEVAKLTSIGEKQIQRWADFDPSFKVFKVGRKTIISVKLLQQYLERKAMARDGYPVRGG